MNFNNIFFPHFGYILIQNLVIAFLSTFVFQTSLYALGDNNTTVNTLLNKNIQDINKSIQGVIIRLDKLEKYKLNNRLVIYKDIDSIYDYVIGSDYTFKMPTETNVTGIFYRSYWIYDSVKYENNETNYNDNVSEYKLLAVEEFLNTSNETPQLDSNSTAIDRIQKIYTILKYDDWNRDRIQFTVLTNYVAKEKAPMISIGVLAFGSYKKYIPGKFDFWRRYAFYLGIGKINSLDETHEYSSIAYSTGINIEIQKGFGLNAGYVLYSTKDLLDTTNPTKTKNSFTGGITLSSELWKSLFNFNNGE